MKLGYKIWIVAVLSVSAVCYGGALNTKTVEVDAPFEMPSIVIPDFSDCPEFSITDFGAELGKPERVSQAIAAAIDRANAAGGGTVVVPVGAWRTAGPVHLKSDVNLHLADGCTLTFSPNPEDYLPAVQTTWEGMECFNYSPLIYAFECTNVAITGAGKLVADMKVWKEWAGRPPAHMQALKRLYYMAAENVPVDERQMVGDDSHLRPQFIQFNRCDGVLLDGVSINYSPFWTVHPFLSKNVVIRNVKVWARGHNNDGVDPEMSQNVLIENCVFDQGDDAISVKSGRNQDAWRLNTPSKNIVLRNCTVKAGHQLIAIGSELSGGVENVLVENIKMEEAWPFYICFIKTNERRGGFVKNIYVRNVRAGTLRNGILGVETDVLYQWKDLVETVGEPQTTSIRGIYLNDIHAEASKFITLIEGQADEPVENVVLSGIDVDSVSSSAKLRNQNVSDFRVDEDD